MNVNYLIVCTYSTVNDERASVVFTSGYYADVSYPLMVEPDKTPKTTTLKLSIDAFNKAVSIGTGYDCLSCCKKLEKGVYLLYADESNALFFTPKDDITVTLNVA